MKSDCFESAGHLQQEAPTGYQYITGVEPRFEAVRRELESLLGLVDIESNGQAVNVTGFRLKNLPAWRTMNSASPLDTLGALSGVCNYDCQFCFERGHPFVQDKSVLSVPEATTRLKYYDPVTKSALFPSSRPYKETFINPDALAILSSARAAQPDCTLWITSNGSGLNEETVAKLAELKPLMIKLSINSADMEIRRQLTGRRRGDATAIRAPELLQKYGIPFMGSIVAWPSVFPDDMTATLHHMDMFEPYTLKVRLPVYHRFLYRNPPFERNFWNRVLEACREIQPELQSPLFVEPSFYWIDPVVPEVDGVVRHSPAAAAGMTCGDRIISVDGESVYTRTHALNLLDVAYRRGRKQVVVGFSRAGTGEDLSCTLSTGRGSYPWDGRVFSPWERWGILLLPDFRMSDLENIMRIIERHDSARPLLFSSPVVAPIARTVIRGIPHYRSFFKSRPLNIRALDRTLLGGNMRLLDGRFVADFIDDIERFARKKGELPDLIMIPNAFGNPWGVDLLNHSFIEIERRFRVPVELVEWPILYGKDV
jgi:hypothetical protein